MSERKRFYRVDTAPDSGSFYIAGKDALREIRPMMEDAEEGEGYTITVVYMTQEEHDALPEFSGF